MKDFAAVFVYLCPSAIWLSLDSIFPELLILENSPPQGRAKRFSVEITCRRVRWHIAGPCRLVLSAPICMWELSLLVAIQCLLHDTVMNMHNTSFYAPNIRVYVRSLGSCFPL